MSLIYSCCFRLVLYIIPAFLALEQIRTVCRQWSGVFWIMQHMSALMPMNRKKARRPRARRSTTGARETPLSNLSKHVPTGDPHRLGLGAWRATASVPRAITKAAARTSFLGVFAGHAAKAVAIQPPRHLRRGDFRSPPIHLGASRCLSSLLPNLELMRLDDEARPCQSHALLSPLQGFARLERGNRASSLGGSLETSRSGPPLWGLSGRSFERLFVWRHYGFIRPNIAP